MLDEPRWVEAAARCAELLLAVHLDETGRLRRVSRAGVAGSPPGVLEDYGALAEGLLSLAAVTGEPRWLTGAQSLIDVALTRFVTDGKLYDTADDATDPRLGRRPLDPSDTASPSGRSAFTHALLLGAAYTGSSEYRAVAERALGAAQALVTTAPRCVSWALAAAESALAGPLEVAVVGPPAEAATRSLHQTAVRRSMAGTAVALGAPPIDDDHPVPLLRHRGLVDGRPAAYVCRQFVCRRPVTDVLVLAGELGLDGQ